MRAGEIAAGRSSATIATNAIRSENQVVTISLESSVGVLDAATARASIRAFPAIAIGSRATGSEGNKLKFYFVLIV